MATAKKRKDAPIAEDEAVLLTKDGLQTLKDEFKELKTTSRKEVAKRLQEAISYGDLSENSEYEEAKNQQAFIEGRIVELERMIKNAKLIDEDKAHKAKIVQIGTTVVIKLQEKGADEEEFTIVGSTEADPLNQRISNESPVGTALLGKKAKDTFKVIAPAGEFEYQLLSLK